MQILGSFQTYPIFNSFNQSHYLGDEINYSFLKFILILVDYDEI
jgi:hypothetical protein